MTDVVIVAVILVVVGLASFYVYKAKKSGQKCIGCPNSKACKSNRGENSCSCVK